MGEHDGRWSISATRVRTMNENREDPVAAMKREIDELAELMSPDLIKALSEAAEEDELWLEAARDTRGFLHERGVALPDWAEIRLEAVFPPTRVRSIPECKGEGEVLVARPGRAYCKKPIYICKKAPHLEELCIYQGCLEWAPREWLDFQCVRARDLGVAQFSISELSLPPIYPGPPGG
jgi:hypothetical protein